MKPLIMVSKFLSCWSHHKLRLQRPMAARNHYRHLQYDSYASLAQVCNWTNEDCESRQQIHYFHCNQIGIQRERTDGEGKTKVAAGYSQTAVKRSYGYSYDRTSYLTHSTEQRRRRKPPTNSLIPLRANRHPTRDCR